MIPAKKMIDAHAQDLMASEELLLSILTGFAQYTHSLYANRNALCFQFVCSSRILCRSYQ